MDAALKFLLSFLLFFGYSAPVVPVASAPPPLVQEFSVAAPFVLSAGASAVLPGEELVITFDGIVEDSRCPKDVLCAWSGRAVVALNVAAAGEEAEVVELGGFTGYEGALQPQAQDSAAARVAGYTVELLAVMPYPEHADAPPAGEEYQVQLVVSKGDAAE